MIVNSAIFTCSICGEPSTDICAFCTKDACANHRCVRCKRCSDCCECEFPLSAEEPAAERIAPAEPVLAPVNLATEPPVVTEPVTEWVDERGAVEPEPAHVDLTESESIAPHPAPRELADPNLPDHE
jgi:hypothetical protein